MISDSTAYAASNRYSLLLGECFDRGASLAALAGALLLILLGSPADELPSNQIVDVPSL
jgi:hypothetical protein